MLFWFEKAVKREIFRISKGGQPVHRILRTDHSDVAEKKTPVSFCVFSEICGLLYGF